MPQYDFPTLFQARCLALLNDLMPVSASVFFLVDADLQHRGAFIRDARTDIEKHYTSTYFELDPLNPTNFPDPDTHVVSLSQRLPGHLLKQSRYYLEFMQPYQHRYVADLFFRDDGGSMVAGVSLLRAEALGDFSAAELALLNKVQPFLEFTLNQVYVPQRRRERASLADRYQLTERELDVVELLVAGASNKAIARQMDLGLATVKTHLNRVFRKLEVRSRSELTAKVLREL